MSTSAKVVQGGAGGARVVETRSKKAGCTSSGLWEGDKERRREDDARMLVRNPFCFNGFNTWLAHRLTGFSSMDTHRCTGAGLERRAHRLTGFSSMDTYIADTNRVWLPGAPPDGFLIDGHNVHRMNLLRPGGRTA